MQKFWRFFYLIIIIIMILNVTQVLSKQPDSDSVAVLISRLNSSDWPIVSEAKWRLESLQYESIQALLAQLDMNRVVELTNTGPLIYPGAKTFYGEGFIIDYDIDYIPARAGWVLEELTFEEFGFKDGKISEDKLMDTVIHGTKDVPMDEVISDISDSDLRVARFREAITRAKSWWENNRSTWTRYHGLIESLKSGNPNRQQWALEWLRYGTTQCDGLNLASYRMDILPIVEKLTKSEDKIVQNQANLLIKDSENWWWKIKSDEKTRYQFEPDSRP